MSICWRATETQPIGADHVTVGLKHWSGRLVERELCKLSFSCPSVSGRERSAARVGHLSGDYVPNWSAWPIINDKIQLSTFQLFERLEIELICIICISTDCFFFSNFLKFKIEFFSGQCVLDLNKCGKYFAGVQRLFIVYRTRIRRFPHVRKRSGRTPCRPNKQNSSRPKFERKQTSP